MLIKKGILILCAVGIFAGAKSQDRHYFIYIQSDHNQLFYVRENGRVMSSSATGYIIIPQLTTGENQLIVGFPKNQFPEQQFNIRITGNHNKGFLLKQNTAEQFVLYDLQDYSMVEPGAVSNGPSFAYNNSVNLPGASSADNSPAADTAGRDTAVLNIVKPSPVKDTTPQADSQVIRFRKLLEAAVNEGKPATPTPAVNASATAKPEAAPVNIPVPPIDTSTVASTVPSGDNNQPAVTDEKTVAKTGEEPAVAATPAVDEKAAAPVNISTSPPDSHELDSLRAIAKRRIEEQANAMADNQAVAVNPVEVKDTAVPAVTPAASEEALSQAAPPVKKEKKKNRKEEPEFITFQDNAIASSSPPAPSAAATGNNEADTKDDTATATAVPAERTPPDADAGSSGGNLRMINSDCKDVASEDQFQKLRRKMAEQHNDAAMLRAAEKYLKQDCYSAAQIQSLAYLLSDNEYRYRLLSEAYPHVYDSDHFPGLEKVFTDQFYRDKFKLLIRK